MTLLTDAKPAAGDSKPATGVKDAAPSSGAGDKATDSAKGKEPEASVNKAGDEGKPKGDDAGAKAAEGDKAKAGAPETYKFKPFDDGSELGEGVHTALSEVSRELNLTNDAAQKLVDKVMPALRAQGTANLNEMVQGWEEETKNDPTIGGAKLAETRSFAARALALCPPELRALLEHPSKGGTGLGNHKAVLAGFAAIGRKLSPDTKVVTGDGGDGDPRKKPAEQRLIEAYRNDAK